MATWGLNWKMSKNGRIPCDFLLHFLFLFSTKSTQYFYRSLILFDQTVQNKLFFIKSIINFLMLQFKNLLESFSGKQNFSRKHLDKREG